MRQIVHIKDGQVDGITILSAWPDDVPYPAPSPEHRNVEVESEHPILAEPPSRWRYDGRRLQRKSDTEIADSDRARAARHPRRP